MSGLEWWHLLGGVATVAVLAGMAEEYVDYPDRIADALLLRWTASVVVGGAAGLAIVVGLHLATVAWDLALLALLAFGILWLLALGVSRLLGRAGAGTRDAGETGNGRGR